MGANNQRFTQEYVEKCFSERGCTLLSEYVNTRTKLNYICSCGRHAVVTFSKFRTNKHNCRACAGVKKYTLDEVLSILNDSNIELMSEYKNANTSFKYKCKICGYEGHTNLSSIFSGHGCMRCGQLRTANLLKEDIEVVRQYFIEHGCVPLFTEYINGHTPLEYICSCGSKSKIAWFDFRAGKRCNNCRMERIHNTMYQNGTQMCSLQQRYLHKLFGGELNYPVGNSSLDIAFPDKKIYIEYDGSGHDLTVKRGDMSRHDFEEREKRRTYKLWRMGWKCVRIISRRDNMPSDDVLQSMLDKAFDVLNDHSWITFDIDNNTVEFSADKYDCDYGETKRMRVS